MIHIHYVSLSDNYLVLSDLNNLHFYAHNLLIVKANDKAIFYNH